MMSSIRVMTFDAPPVCEREVLRYASCREADEATVSLMRGCIASALPSLSYKVCYAVFDVNVTGDECDFGVFCVRSKDLAKNLSECERVLLFGATVGLELDRLIEREARLSPSKALFLQAFGAERIEALCDMFCERFEKENGVSLAPRFSSGYGDLDIETQRDIFGVLNPQKNIGLFLNESMLMSPSKSVTAFAGISKRKASVITNKCHVCGNDKCSFRRI